MTNARLPFDKRSFGLRQTLVWVSTNARLCLVFPSFVRGQTKARFSSSEVAEYLFQSRGFLGAFLGVFRCCRGSLLMPCMASLRWVYGTPSMVIRDPFDGYTGLPRWLYEPPLMEIRFLSLTFPFLLNVSSTSEVAETHLAGATQRILRIKSLMFSVL